MHGQAAENEDDDTADLQCCTSQHLVSNSNAAMEAACGLSSKPHVNMEKLDPVSSSTGSSILLTLHALLSYFWLRGIM